MSDTIIVEKIVTEVQGLPYAEKIRVLEAIVQSLHTETERSKRRTFSKSGFGSLFGIWKNRDVSLESIREKAWKR